MQMTDSEIRAEYNTAKDKREQVGVLADLNACSHDEIVAKLKELGCDVPEQKRTYKKLDTGRALALFIQGKTQKEIADELGVSVATIRSWQYRERLSKGMKPKKEPKEKPKEKPKEVPVIKADLLQYAKREGYICSACMTEFAVFSGGKDETKETRFCPWCGASFTEG